MTKNYFEQEANHIEDLKHFPYKNFEEFELAIKDGEIIDFGIPMDYARKWVTSSKDAPKGWMYVSNFLLLFPWLLIIFYIFMAFVSGNYWLILYSMVPVVFVFFANPLGRKVFKIHYYFIGIYILLAFFIKELWSLIYWFPLMLVYLSLNQLYSGSAQLVRENLSKNEKLVCLFWKWWDMVIYKKDGRQYSQRDFRFNELVTYNEDIQEEWREYIDKTNLNPNTVNTSEAQENVNLSIDTSEQDPIYLKVKEFIKSKKKITVSELQKRYDIGYSRGARILDHLEQDGLVGSAEGGGKPRQVLTQNNIYYCSNCGQILNSGSKFCKYCGTKQNEM